MTSAFGAAGRRVGDGGRRARRVGRVVQVPALHPGLVDPGGEDRAAVRRPPVAPEPAELLGRDELGQPPGHPGVLAGQQGVGAVGVDHPQLTPAHAVGRVGHVRQPLPGRVGRGSTHRAGGGAPRPRRRAPGRPGTAARPSANTATRPAASSRVRADAGGAEPQPLAQRPLAGGQVAASGRRRAASPGRRPAAPRRWRRRSTQSASAGSSGPAERRKTTRAPSSADGHRARRAVAEPAGAGGQLRKVHTPDRRAATGGDVADLRRTRQRRAGVEPPR